jgi:hemerythrin-like metal-binding protein
MPIRVQWDATFSVGNEVLDRQHQRLLSLCNDMAECISAGRHEALFRFHDILYQLTQYAREHFIAEEKLLEKYRYAALAAQQAEHGAYDEKMADWAFAATMDSIDMREVQRYLAVWWRDHILISDMQYKALMESKG